MPTRYLKPGIRDSGRIEGLSDMPDAECLYYRLLVTVDDFGRFDARPLLIKAACFPLRLRANADKCIQWLNALVSVGLIIIYTVDNKDYLQITNWDNKPRAAESKFPNPPTDVYKCPQMLPVTVTGTGTGTKTGTETQTTPSLSGTEKKLNGKAQFIPDAESVLEYLNRNAGKGFEFRNRNGELTTSADKIIQRLKQGYTALELREVVYAKCQQWAGDDKMVEYLRPSTLFSKEKFEQYLGEMKGN